MLTTYLSGLVGEPIAELVSFNTTIDGELVSTFGCVIESGAKILPTFYEDEGGDYLGLFPTTDGTIDPNVGDYVRREATINALTAAGAVQKMCGDETETSVISSLLFDMSMKNERLNIVTI